MLPQELGPRKRYRLDVLEAVCIAAGGAKARIAAAAGGVRPERNGAWLGLWQSRAADLIRFLERWLLWNPLGRRPVLVPRMSDIACLHQLLGIAEGGARSPRSRPSTFSSRAGSRTTAAVPMAPRSGRRTIS